MIDLNRLETWLAQSNLKSTNQPLWQVIVFLITATRQLQQETEASIAGTGGEIVALSDLDFLTWTDESIPLPNSRQLIAGTNILFDDTVVNQRTISASGTGSDGIWMPLTDGVTPETQIVFDGFGSCIMVFVPQP